MKMHVPLSLFLLSAVCHCGFAQTTTSETPATTSPTTNENATEATTAAVISSESPTTEETTSVTPTTASTPAATTQSASTSTSSSVSSSTSSPPPSSPTTSSPVASTPAASTSASSTSASSTATSSSSSTITAQTQTQAVNTSDTVNVSGSETTSPKAAGLTSSTTTATETITQIIPTTKFPSRRANIETSQYIFVLPVGPGKSITSNLNSTLLLKEIEDAFQLSTGYTGVEQNKERSGDKELQFDVLYKAHRIVSTHKPDDPANKTEMQIADALALLNRSDNVNVSEIGEDLKKAISDFVRQTSDICKASGICHLGYYCLSRSENDVKCLHMCEKATCKEHGQCEVIISGTGETTMQCRCLSDDMYVYTGNDCQHRKMQPDVVMAIIGGVLGGFSFLLLVIIYCMCCRSKTKHDKNYTLNQNAHYNESYESSTNLQMKSV